MTFKDCRGQTPLDIARSNIHNNRVSHREFVGVFRSAFEHYDHEGGFGFEQLSNNVRRSVRLCVRARRGRMERGGGGGGGVLTPEARYVFYVLCYFEEREMRLLGER